MTEAEIARSVYGCVNGRACGCLGDGNRERFEAEIARRLRMPHAPAAEADPLPDLTLTDGPEVARRPRRWWRLLAWPYGR